MNYNALRAQLVLKGKKMCDLRKAIGISESAMQRKMNGKSEFTRSEMQVIIDYLDIENPMDIFFNEKVS